MKKSDNFLDYVPVARAGIFYVGSTGERPGHLAVVHKSWADRLAQRLWHRPAVTMVQLERFGSFIWQCMDGEKSIYDIGLALGEHFGPEAEPLFLRICAYFRLLERGGYVRWKKNNGWAYRIGKFR